MDTKDAIRAMMDVSLMVFKGYLGDLDEEGMMVRPGDGCNHPAWQCGHLISSEVMLLELCCPGAAAELPEGFAEAHSKEMSGSDDRAKFKTRDEYMAIWEEVRAATLKALDEFPDARFDEESPESFRDFCPTLGHMFVLIGNHPMMHAGQFVPIRRKLGKPVLF